MRITCQADESVDSDVIVGIPFFNKAIVLGIHKRESATLHNSINIIIIVLYVVIHLSYYIINPCVSASTNLDDYFSSFASSSNTYMIIY
ncbi:XXYS1_4_G0034060.mRNA.1.CDS.1 [Saccharomyces cerevisiae]|nr:EM14S01-3B_G0031470.mRNA.1.CDS.1 [Saccharomyces cerevisiae]CAD6625353.1 XXYS1_4_G0034060.mRNA.1.CDS.1 [Saccharomyces cerevisiae]